jgi:hypothetical protein
MKFNKMKANSNYYPLVGDPCYRYRKEVKERFFNDISCSILYLLSIQHLKLKKSECALIIDEMAQLGRKTLQENKIALP